MLQAAFSAYVPLMIALALRLAPEPYTNLSFWALAAYALLGRAHAIRALIFCWLFLMLNPGLVPEATGATVGRFVVLIAALAAAILHSGYFIRKTHVHHFTQYTLLLGVFIISHSLMFSSMVDVSVLKALSWALATATLVSAWLGLFADQRQMLAQELFWFLIAILLVSLPLTVTPEGYLVNGTGFQGILNHPQVFGPTAALLGTWAAARVFGERRPAWWLVGLTGLCLTAVLMSEARTAGFAMIGAVGLSILLAPLLSGQSVSRIMPGLRSPRVWTLLGALSLSGLAMAPEIASIGQTFITKSSRADVGDLLEAYERSRGVLMAPMLMNIAEHPLTGIGFGIASEQEFMIVQRDPILGLPVGASTEKGITPLAVLEELGIFGAVLVALWIMGLVRGSARSGFVPFAVCLSALLLNMGEATLFSPGGMGLLTLVLFGWTYSSGNPRKILKWSHPYNSGSASSRLTWRA